MIFRGLFDLTRLLISIAYSIIRDAVFAFVYIVGAPGVVIIAIALLWWFGWLPGIIDFAASFLGIEAVFVLYENGAVGRRLECAWTACISVCL